MARSLFRRVGLRILPLLMLLTTAMGILNWNATIAALTMNVDLNISDKEFGFATSLQSALNLVMEVPMTLLVAVLGNKVGIPLLFLGLGGVSVASGFANSFTAVVVTRGAGGIMCSGIWPSIMNVVATFFPKAQLGLAMGILDVASYIAGVVRAPLASLIFATTDGWHGLASWRWLFILEGAGCGLVAAILAVAFVPSSLSSVSWLSEAEKDIVRNGDGGNRQKDKGAAAAAAVPKSDGLFADDETSMKGVADAASFGGDVLPGGRRDGDARRTEPATSSLWQTFTNGRMWLYGLLGLVGFASGFGLGPFFSLMLQRASGSPPWVIAMLGTAPGVASALGTLANGLSSDYFRERFWHVTVWALVGAAFMGATGYAFFAKLGIVWIVVLYALGSAFMQTWLPAFLAAAMDELGADPGPLAGTWAIQGIGGAVMPILFGYILDAWGNVAVMVAVVAIQVLFVVLWAVTMKCCCRPPPGVLSGTHAANDSAVFVSTTSARFPSVSTSERTPLVAGALGSIQGGGGGGGGEGVAGVWVDQGGARSRTGRTLTAPGGLSFGFGAV